MTVHDYNYSCYQGLLFWTYFLKHEYEYSLMLVNAAYCEYVSQNPLC